MASPASNVKALNTEFAGYLYQSPALLAKLSPQDRANANKWITRLRIPATNLKDMKVRNNVMVALIMQMQVGALTAPFHVAPRYTNLSDIPVADLNAENIFPEGFKLPMLLQSSPDQGAFLVTQPVPKCGAFCYLAVVSRPPNK